MSSTQNTLLPLEENTAPKGSSKEVAPADPLSEEQARSLLIPVDIIRDPLHGDIHLTALERFLIDTPEFQRLRKINQLAMTYMAYPGALHTRFLHSLGVLHVCAEMLATCNRNAANYSRLALPADPVPQQIGSYPMLLARVCALLHDLAHVAFGHTLEKEGRIFQKDEWQDAQRREMLLGEESNLSRQLQGYFAKNDLEAESATGLVSDARQVLAAKGEAIEMLPYPFVHDLVGNTICADLIDYVQRDMYFCGLTEQLGKRFLDYLGVMPLKRAPRPGSPFQPFVRNSAGGSAFRTHKDGAVVKMCRLVLIQYRYNERKVFVHKPDIVSEAIDLVRRRLTVAEKLYFHRTKIVASSMLVAAAKVSGLTAEAIWELSDNEVLKHLERSEHQRAVRLAGKLQSRRLLKPIYRANFRPWEDTPESNTLWDERRGVYSKFKEPEKRTAFVDRLERLIETHLGKEPGSAAGSVTMSCPHRDMNLKAFDMLVIPRPGESIIRLQDSKHRPTQEEIRAIQDRHKSLWRIDVFVDPDIVSPDPTNEFVRKFAGAIRHEIGLPNEFPGFSNVPSVDLNEWETELLVKAEISRLGADNITHAHFEELVSSRTLDPRGSREHIRDFLEEKGYLKSSR